MSLVPISISIITHNESARIRPCLESVAWADEIVVVDAESDDDTVSICREFTDRIYIRPWPGFARQKQFALDQCRNEWVLSVDADERVRPDLAEEIQTIIPQAGAVNGYRIARRSYFLGRWIQHCGWYPGYQVRLFKRLCTRVSEARVHEGFLVSGDLGVLDGALDHFSHGTLAESLDKMNRYSSLEALDRLERKRVRAIDFIIHPLAAFSRKYFSLSGYRDGMPGLLLCWISALVNMATYMKLWRLQRMSAEELQSARERHW